MKVKINRTGFRKAPATIEENASAALRGFIDATGATRVRAVLRPATYCGPGSAGDLGEWILDLTGDGSWRHGLYVISQEGWR
jgi:hypothetical protein